MGDAQGRMPRHRGEEERDRLDRDRGFFKMLCKPRKRIFLLTTFRLCDNNGYTSTQIHNFFCSNGFRMVETPDEADYIVISTCGFDQERENASRSVIEQYIDRFSKYKLIVICGCLTKINPKLFDQANVITIGPKELHRFNQIFQADIRIEDVSGGKLNDRFIDRDYGIFDAYYLQICQGCVNSCTYCAIKKAKGHVTSKPLHIIIHELEQAINDGFTRIMLLGDDCGSYGVDLGFDFSDLLNELANFKVGISINYVEPGRFLYLYPKLKRSTFERIEFINIPVQSTSNRIIRLMGRHYEVDNVFRLVREMRQQSPDIFLETHMMYGFPTETREEFEASFRAAEYFDSVIYFYYTDRKNVRSSLLDGKISGAEINHRTQAILNHPRFRLNRDSAIPPMIMLGYDIQAPQDIFKSIEGSIGSSSEIDVPKEGVCA
ncbi:MAG: radical SAM protein [Nitrospirae bacterium]|nr:radical SAM protein [Nitrospirota bacterium]